MQITTSIPRPPLNSTKIEDSSLSLPPRTELSVCSVLGARRTWRLRESAATADLAVH
jgi:hypothetical protein